MYIYVHVKTGVDNETNITIQYGVYNTVLEFELAVHVHVYMYIHVHVVYMYTTHVLV